MASHTFAPISAFLFDMDGTLVDSHEVVERCWRRWGQSRNVDPEKILAYCHGRQARSTIAHFRPDLDTAAETRQMLAWELKEPGGTHPIGDAGQFLKQLPHGSWAVVTSAARDLALHRLKCADLPAPPILIAAEDVTRSKPDPEGFLRAAKQLGVPPEQALVFEDSVIGLAAGRAGGMPTLQICASHPPSVPESPYRCMDYRAVSLAPYGQKQGKHPSFEVRVELLKD